MIWQRNIFQTKEQDKTPEELSEVEIGNLPEKEFRVMIIKMMKELRRRMHRAKSSKFLTELEKTKNNQRCRMQ